MEDRGKWKSTFGFVLAAVGSAIGLGNIWRFSYLCYKNGGGAFLIPYFIALIVAGIPIMLLEYALGHKKQGSAPLAMAKINRKWEWLGWWPVTFVMFGIELYYCVIIAWCLCYLFLSFSQGWGNDPNTYFFGKFLDLSASPKEIGSINTKVLFATMVIWFANWAICFKKIEHGIERACKIFMPLLFTITFILVGWGLTLKGAGIGIKHYLKPNFSLLTNPQVWTDAFGQIFFTLSLGFGIMIAYASYLPRKVDLVKSAYITAFINCTYSFIAGFAVFSVLGHTAFTTGQPFGEVVKESIGLAFVAYPQALNLIPLGKLFGVLFFLALTIAGLSSSISIIEAFTSAILDKFKSTRGMVVTILCIIGFLGSCIFTTQAGLYWLDIVDHFLNQYGLMVVGMLECLVIGWYLGTEPLIKHINAISEIKIGKIWTICIRFISPLILIYMIIQSLISEVTQPYGGYSWVAILLLGKDWVIITLFAAVIFTEFNWAKGRLEIKHEAEPEALPHHQT